MSVPKIVKGQYFDVAVDPDGDGNYTAICGLTTKNLTHQFQTGDEYLRDCQDPTQVPFRVVNITGQQFDIAGTGVFNRAQGDLIRNLGGQSFPYRYIMGEPADDQIDAGYFAGNFVLSNIQYGAADGVNTTAQFTWVSDGEIDWVPGAEIVVLKILDLNPKVATHGVSYTGTVSGTTLGSTLVATSNDGTTLTVTGSGTTRTIGGTFTAAGNKQITLVETLAGAVNSPRTGRLIVAVA